MTAFISSCPARSDDSEQDHRSLRPENLDERSSTHVESLSDVAKPELADESWEDWGDGDVWAAARGMLGESQMFDCCWCTCRTE
jgi:hypothetical protein